MSQVELDASEDAPFLADGERADQPIPPSKTSSFSPLRWQAKSPRTIIILIAIIKFAFVTSGMLMLIPVYRLIEDAICHAHYQDDSDDLIEEMKCKVDEVQSRLAFILGWCGLLNAVMTLLVAFPYGALADKIGRKPTALLAYGGLAISFSFTPLMLGTYKGAIRRNPYLLMTGSLFLLVGGGVQVMLATLYAIATDVSDEKEKASNFLYLTFGATAGGLLGPLTAGLLMEHFGPWVPIYVVLAMTPMIFCIFLFIPETLTVNVETERLENQTPLEAMRSHVTNGVRDFRKSLRMLRNANIQLILVTFFTQSPRFAAYTTTLTQYISKHFGWKLHETSLLLSPLGVLNLLVLVLLPKISEILLSARFGYTTFRKDLFLTRASTIILIVAALIEGFSHNVVLFLIGLFIGVFGAADSPLARATISHYAEPEYTSRLYALISMAEILGSFVGGPVLAWFFDKGLRGKGLWIGLPWFYVAALCTVCYVALLFVQPPKPKDEAVSSESVYRDEENVNLDDEGEYRD